MRSVLGLLFLSCVAHADVCQYLPSPLKFSGEFGKVTATSLECEHLLRVTKYETEHFRTGPTGRTSVLHFRSDLPAAFLDKMSFVGLLGPDCDIAVDKKLELGGKTYRIHSEGIVDADFILVTVKVKVFQNGAEVCHLESEYSGFSN